MAEQQKIPTMEEVFGQPTQPAERVPTMDEVFNQPTDINAGLEVGPALAKKDPPLITDNYKELLADFDIDEKFKEFAYPDPLRINYDPAKYDPIKKKRLPIEIPIVKDLKNRGRTVYKPDIDLSERALQPAEDGNVQFNGRIFKDTSDFRKKVRTVESRVNDHNNKRAELITKWQNGDLSDSEFRAYHKDWAPTVGRGITPAKMDAVINVVKDKHTAQGIFLRALPLKKEDEAQIITEILSKDIDPNLERKSGSDKWQKLPSGVKKSFRTLTYNFDGFADQDFVKKFLNKDSWKQSDFVELAEGYKNSRQYKQNSPGRNERVINTFLNGAAEQPSISKPLVRSNPIEAQATPQETLGSIIPELQQPDSFTAPGVIPELQGTGAAKGSVFQFLESRPQPSTDIGRAAELGLQSSIAANLLFAADKHALGTNLLTKTNFQPRTPAESAIATAVSWVDPALLVVNPLTRTVFGSVSKVAKPLAKAYELIAGSKLGKAAVEAAQHAKGSEFLGLSPGSAIDKIGSVNRRVLQSQFADDLGQIVSKSFASAKTGSTIGALASTARQLDEEGGISLPQLGVDTAVGAGFGVAGDLAVRGLAKGAGKLFPKRNLIKPLVTLADGTTAPASHVDDALDFATAKVKEYVDELPDLPASQRSAIATEAFYSSLGDKGVNVAAIGQGDRGMFSKGLLNKTVHASFDDKRLGTRLTELEQNAISAATKRRNLKADFVNEIGPAIKALDDMGYSRGDQTKMLFHTESLPDGRIQFNPNGAQISNNFMRMPYDGPKVTPEAQQALASLRKWYDQGWTAVKKFQPDTGRLTGYVNLVERPDIVRSPSEKLVKNIDNIGKPGFTNRRTSEFFDPKKHIDDLGVLADHYAEQRAYHTAFGPLVTDVQRELSKMSLLGQPKRAEFWGNHFARLMGLNSKRDIIKLAGNEIVEANREVLEQMLSQITRDPSKVDEILSGMKQISVNNMLFTSPRIYLQQMTQPSFMGVAEIGRPWIQRGAALARNKNSAASKVADEMMDIMAMKDPAFIFEAENIEATNKLMRKAIKVSDVLAHPVKYANNARDIYNRKVSFIGAYEQFKARPLTETLENMNFGEQRYIQRVLKTEGEEAAARAYGVVRSRRINFIYGLADAPEFFAQGLGAFIPFSTWSRSTLSRFVEDVAEGNIETLAKRILDPLMLRTQFALQSGLEIQGVDPVQAATGAVKAGILPLQDPNSALNSIPAFLPGSQLVKTSAKLVTESPAKKRRTILKQFSLQPVKKDSHFNVFRKEVQKIFKAK